MLGCGGKENLGQAAEWKERDGMRHGKSEGESLTS